jgi:hypothetical protein
MRTDVAKTDGRPGVALRAPMWGIVMGNVGILETIAR